MELPIPLTPAGSVGFIFHQALVFGQIEIGDLEVYFFKVGHRLAQDVALQYRPSLEHLFNLSRLYRGDDRTMVGNNLDQAFGFKMGKSFAYRNFADMKLVRQRILQEPLSSLQLSAKDLFT